tara:strand:+ start:957 stop:1760 length:804 start_codon:yes stop_codon:yes gene_type:complete
LRKGKDDMERPIGSGPGIPLEIPKNVDVVEYLASFSSAFSQNQAMQKALGGVQDSIRQARLLREEPLGLFACLTAEEEASSFLYHAFLSKNYGLPDYGKLQNHGDKVKIFLLCMAIIHYYFREELVRDGLRVRIAREGKNPSITCYFPIAGHTAIIRDPFETVVTIGEGVGGFDQATDDAVDEVVKHASNGHKNLASAIRYLKNRRNRCIYGPLKLKYALRDDDELNQYISNAVSIIICGFIIYFKHQTTGSMGKILEKMFDRLELR